MAPRFIAGTITAGRFRELTDSHRLLISPAGVVARQAARSKTPSVCREAGFQLQLELRAETLELVVHGL